MECRPGLYEFLEALADDPDIEVHVFTAALPLYARPVLNAIDPKNKMLFSRFYRKSCSIRNGVHGKDLSVIPGYSPERTLLIDNNPVSFLPNPQNGLLVTSWHDDNTDTQLNEVLDLLVRMKTERDVRPLIDAYCGARVRAATKRFAGIWARGQPASI
jgi:CTD small phosphatase-like protein 2